MKITYLHQYFNTPSMPGGTRSFEMARRLVAAGHAVNLVTSKREPGPETGWHTTLEEGIKVHWYPVRYSNHMGFLKRVQAFLWFAIVSSRKAASLDADVVFATSTPLTIVLPALFAAFRRRIPMVFEVRDMWPAVPIAMGVIKNRCLKIAAAWLERLAYKRAQHVVTLAPGMRDDVIATGVDPTKVTVIPNGCDIDVFGGDLAHEAAFIRAKHVWLQTRKLVLFAGTLGRANGVEFLVRVAAQMKEIDQSVRFVVIGDGAERDKIRECARNLGVLDKNLFLLPAMPKVELAKWIAACDFTVGLFSGPRVLWKDAVQNKFFDSLAAGKPVACNFEGFQSQLAVKRGVGLILPADNPLVAARQLYEKLNTPFWLKAASEKARYLARGEFSRDKLAQQLESVLLAAVQQWQTKRGPVCSASR